MKLQDTQRERQGIQHEMTGRPTQNHRTPNTKWSDTQSEITGHPTWNNKTLNMKLQDTQREITGHPT
jgi:hypothetical protein